MKPNTHQISSKINFNKSGYFFMALIPLMVLGFWEKYFSKILVHNNNVSSYFHFHAIMMAVWVAFLIIQPILIRKRKLRIHRVLGKASYIMMPVILLSILMMIHRSGKSFPKEEQLFVGHIQPIMMFLVLSSFYLLAVIYRRNIHIHARAMIVTGLTLLDPILMRFLTPIIWILPTILLIMGIFITLIILERKQKKGRWIFPAALSIFIITYIPLVGYSLFDIIPATKIAPLDSMVRWFYSLPIT